MGPMAEFMLKMMVYDETMILYEMSMRQSVGLAEVEICLNMILGILTSPTNRFSIYM